MWPVSLQPVGLNPPLGDAAVIICLLSPRTDEAGGVVGAPSIDSTQAGSAKEIVAVPVIYAN